MQIETPTYQFTKKSSTFVHFLAFTELERFPSGVLSVIATNSVNILTESKSLGQFITDFIRQYRSILCKCGEIVVAFHFSIMKLAQ